MHWYITVTTDLNKLPDFIEYHENQIKEAHKEVKISGNLEKCVTSLPGITEYRFNQLQEVEAVLNYMNIHLKKILSKHYIKYREKYNRELKDNEARKYAECEDDVIDYQVLINEVAMVRNKWTGIMKGLESKSFMLGHAVRLRVAGMEDVSI